MTYKASEGPLISRDMIRHQDIEVTFNDSRIIVQRCESFHTAPECEFEHYERCSLPASHRGVHVAIRDNLTSSWSTPTGDTLIFAQRKT